MATSSRARASKTGSNTGKAFDHSVVKSQVTDAALVQRRREQIVAAAVGLFSRQGYYRTTIQQIARSAGVSIGLIYQYAQTKEDVLLLSLMYVMERFKQEISQHPSDGEDPLVALRDTLATYCRVVDRNRNAAVLAYRSTMSLPKTQREFIKRAEVETNELVAVHVRACIGAGLFREVDVELVTYQIVLYAHTWALKHWRLSQLTTIQGYIAHGFDFHVRALATAKGLEHYAAMPKASGKSGKPKQAEEDAAAA